MSKLDEIEKNVLEELDDYTKFNHGWDGYNGEVFSVDLISQIKDFLICSIDFFKENNFVPDDVSPGPCSDGSVDLDFEYENLEILITFSDVLLDGVTVYVSYYAYGSKSEEIFSKNYKSLKEFRNEDIKDIFEFLMAEKKINDTGPCPYCGGESDGTVMYSSPLQTKCKNCGKSWGFGGPAIEILEGDEARDSRPVFYQSNGNPKGPGRDNGTIWTPTLKDLLNLIEEKINTLHKIHVVNNNGSDEIEMLKCYTKEYCETLKIQVKDFVSRIESKIKAVKDE